MQKTANNIHMCKKFNLLRQNFYINLKRLEGNYVINARRWLDLVKFPYSLNTSTTFSHKIL